MVVKSTDRKLAAVLLTDTGLVRLVEGDPYADEQTKVVGTYPFQSPNNARGDDYDPFKNDIFVLGVLVHRIALQKAITFQIRRKTKRAVAADCKKILKAQSDLTARLGLSEPDALISTLYTDEENCPTLEEVLACEFLSEGSVGNGNAGLASIDEEDVANDFGAMEISGSGASEAERDFCRMLIMDSMSNSAIVNQFVSWSDFIANVPEMLAPKIFQIMISKSWNQSFSGISDFFGLFEEVKSGNIYDFFKSPACTTENANPYNRDLLGSRKKTTMTAARTAALNMADALNAAYVARSNELNDSPFRLDDMVGIIDRQFSEAPGFKEVVDRERRLLGKRLYAIHLHHEENWEEDGDDGDNNDGGNGDNE